MSNPENPPNLVSRAASQAVFLAAVQNLFALKTKSGFLWAGLLAALLAAGCASPKHKTTAVSPAPMVSTAIVTPEMSLAAKVISVNTVGRFVVLNFPAGQLPKPQTTVFLYRAGLKVAEIKITGPQEGNNTVGDVISGEANAGDSVRDQ